MALAPTPCLVVGPLTSYSGNQSTLVRIAGYLNAPIVDISQRAPQSEGSFAPRSYDCQVCVFLHAYRSGQYIWPEGTHNPPRVHATRYVAVFGGTDVNEDSKEEEARVFMGSVLRKCSHAVCFAQELADHARAVWGDEMPPHVVIAPQAVSSPIRDDAIRSHDVSEAAPIVHRVLSEADGFSRLGECSLNNSEGTETRSPIVVLFPAAIRSVKDQVFALEAWKLLEESDTASDSTVDRVVKRAVLLLLGPVLDEAYNTEKVMPIRQRLRRAVWHSGVSRDVLWQLMGDDTVCCVLNTSRSEGQPQALLEAMCVGLAVIARDIPGNTAVVSPAIGTLVNTPQQLADAIRHILHSKANPHSNEAVHIRSQTSSALEFVRTVHTEKNEAKIYRDVVNLNGLTANII